MADHTKPDAKPYPAYHRRNLPHFEPGTRAVFVTFCTIGRWRLPEGVRGAVLRHCLHDHAAKLWMHVVVVMPDHVHLLLTMACDGQGEPYGLGEVLQAMKGASAHTVNRLLRRKGSVWQDESFDRVLRSDESTESKAHYVEANPVRWGLAGDPDCYAWLWLEWVEGKAANS